MQMKTLILYDSFFGNTEKIARTIGQNLGVQRTIKVLKVSEVKAASWSGLDLLIVGSPTRGFRPSEAVTAFLQSIPKDGLKGKQVAAFDTGIGPKDIKSFWLRALIQVAGYAALPIAKQLQKKGGELILPPEGFLVQGTKGPLKEGELKRAATWAKKVLQAWARR